MQCESQEDFTLLEEPSASAPGKFKVRLYPFCGEQEQFCSVELQVTYRDAALHEVYSINEEEAEGLSHEQVNDLQEELKSIQLNQDNVYDVICSLRDYLSFLNP